VADTPGSTASALARDADVPRATATRTLRTLEDAGLVEQRDDGWALGYELVRLARAADPFGGTLAAARAPLERLRDAVGESALLAVPLGPTEMEIVLQVDAPHIIGVTDWVGTYPPLDLSAAGKLLLAELSDDDLDRWLDGEKRAIDRARLRRELARVRTEGEAVVVVDELEEGLASLAAPVRDVGGLLVGMVGLSGPTFRLNARRRREVLRFVLEAAAATASALRG
jgi:DNA-binding IclR family transcriptional regulator